MILRRFRHALLRQGTSAQLWHNRLGHLNENAILTLIKNSEISACNKVLNSCSSCMENKAHVLPHQLRKTIYIQPLELVFVDIWGPNPNDIK